MDDEDTMRWVTEAREALSRGETVVVRPHGGSMRGRVESGQQVTLAPTRIAEVAIDDVVFVRWKDTFLLHLMKAVESERILIGNTLGKINGWVPAADLLGEVVSTEPHPIRDDSGAV
jgi:hypothetical protein